MRRRSLIAAFAAVFAGCSGRNTRSGRTETVTPVAVPESTPGPDAPIPIGDSRFDAETPCPGEMTCFHEIDAADPTEVVVAPSRELYSPSTTAGRVLVRNEGRGTLSVAVGWRLFKYSGQRWVRVQSPTVSRNGVVTVPENEAWRRDHRIEGVFGLPVLGPGLYARAEVAWFGVRQNSRQVPAAALFEVEGTTLELAPSRRARVEDGVAEVSFSDRVDTELVFRRVDAGDAVDIVPEAVGAIPVFKNGIALLNEAPEVRVRTGSGNVAFDYLDAATVGEESVESGDIVSTLGHRFSVDLEER